jgi:predicted RecB family nuclease
MKSHLRRHSTIGSDLSFVGWQCRTLEIFREKGLELLRSMFRDEECFNGTAPLEELKKFGYRLVTKCRLTSGNIHSYLDAVEISPMHEGQKMPSYIPIRLLLEEKISNSDKLLLAYDALAVFYAVGVMPRVGKIIHGNHYKSKTIQLKDLIAKAYIAVATLEAQLLSSMEPPLVLNKHCIICEFRSRCRRLALEKDDLSLLANLTAREQKKYNERGIFTIKQLSYSFRPRRESKYRTPMANKHDPTLKALAIHKNLIHVVGSPKFSVPENVVYFDVEGSLDQKFYYLIGMRYKVCGEYIYHPFWIDRRQDEQMMLESFLRSVSLLSNPYFVHYGSYENKFIKSMKDKYGSMDNFSSTIDMMLSSSINSLSLIYSQIYFPTYSNGLKDVAHYLGFRWTDDGASGLDAIVWRSDWEASHSAALKQRLLVYNAEDCEAVQKVAEAIAGVCSEQAETGREVTTVATSVNTNSLGCNEYQPQFGALQYALPGFEPINKAAYWDYQRARVYIRSNQRLKQSLKKQQKAAQSSRPNTNKIMQATEKRPTVCPQCGETKFYKNGRCSRFIYDLKFFSSGIKR